ncbi:hypothetical protein [Telluribacter sp. SYSU D00476]|uniref:hypothetical protein n=1 Tax=Telluribacter sp. SYSU D00476 TaxID=2811430 RepID=UPI001FF45D58|nr:hypothetical protein [Telluribacter sp. SYSU D00476]
MSRLYPISQLSGGLVAVALCLSSCQDHNLPADAPTTEVQFANHSVTPVLAKTTPAFSSIKMYSLIGSDDQLSGSPSFIFGGSADGAGMLRNSDGTFTMLVNHEDNFAVSRIALDKTLKPTKGEYILNSDGGVWRLCSATMATPKEHGFGPLFLTSGESGEESRTHGVNPYADASQASVSRELPGLGRWSAENAVPLPKTAFAGKTVIIIGDDDSGTYGGQVVMYVANSVGDLENGSLYMLRRTDKNQKEMSMKVGEKHQVEFVKIEDHKSLTGKQLNEKVNSLQAMKFGRVEDIDYAKDGKGRDVYFNVTGQNNTGANADYSRTKYGRVYHLALNDDLTTGTLEVLLDGDDRSGKAKEFQNVDNICVTKNYIYIQEDPNGYGDETHDSRIYQYSLKTKELKVVMELDHRRTAADAAKYNVGGTSGFGDWEYGALVDISEETGVADSFMLCIQPHTWRADKLKGVDGGSKRLNENQASQIVILQGLPR